MTDERQRVWWDIILAGFLMAMGAAVWRSVSAGFGSDDDDDDDGRDYDDGGID